MKKLFPVLLLWAVFPIPTHSWGFFGHKTINYTAVFTLPDEMFGFYKKHIYELREQAVNPDKRRYINPDEAPRHYLDVDFYEQAPPLDTIPKKWSEVTACYGEDTVTDHGIVPWHVLRVHRWLTSAFSDRDPDRIIRLSADLGHYIGDLHVPLHSTRNYNGQLTGQTGIHGFWESRLPELFSSQYELYTGEARYIQNPPKEVWERLEQSFAAKDSVLLIEKMIHQQTRSDDVYSFETRGTQTVKTYSETYSRTYHEALDNMVEQRLRASIEFLGSMWYTAWVDAGQPDLNDLQTTDKSKESIDSVNVVPGKILGRPEPQG